MDRIDAAGLACPQPVLLALEKIKTAEGPFEIAVNNQAAVENVTRAVESQKWTVSGLQTDKDTFILTVSKS